MKTHFPRILTLLLCLALALSCVPGASAALASTTGSHQDVTISTSNGSIGTSAYVLPTSAVNCKSFRLDVSIEMKRNSKCTDWDIWIGNGNSYAKAGTLYLPGGTGKTSTVVKLNIAKTFDSVTITPTSRGSYSWRMELSVSDIVTDTSISTVPGPGVMAGSWGDEDTIKDEQRSFRVNSYVLATPLTDCISFDLAIEVVMKGKARSNDWTVWVRSNGVFHEIGQLYLQNGQGYISGTMYPRAYGNFDAVAVVPTAPGSYTYTIDLEVSNIVTLDTAPPTSEPIPGDYGMVKITSDHKAHTVPAFIMAYSLKNCSGFDLEVEIDLKKNVRCKQWEVWVLRGSGYSKVGTVELPDGTGFGSTTITFDSARPFDGVALVPAKKGSFTWDLYVEITNPR